MWALLLAIVPFDPVIRERASRLETNSLYDDNGSIVFTQIIAWSEYPDGEHVFMWVMMKEQVQPVQRVRGGYFFSFDDGRNLREIWSLSHSETWEQFDPELADRSQLPVEKRRQLRQGRHERHDPPPSAKVSLR